MAASWRLTAPPSRGRASPSMAPAPATPTTTNFVADGPTTVTFSNGADVMTGGDPGDTDVVQGLVHGHHQRHVHRQRDIATADGMNWTFDQGATLTLSGGGNLAEGGAVGADMNGTGTDRQRHHRLRGRLGHRRQRTGHWRDRCGDFPGQRQRHRRLAVSGRLRRRQRHADRFRRRHDGDRSRATPTSPPRPDCCWSAIPAPAS